MKLTHKFEVNGKFYDKIIRCHVSGDFFSQTYFDSWLLVAKNNPNVLIYAYTKALPLWIKRLNEIPSNFVLTASYGGTHDHLIKQYGLKSATVVYSVEEAKKLGLPIDHDDSLAYGSTESLALLIHSQQPKGTPAAKAWAALKMAGTAGYGKHKESTIKTGEHYIPHWYKALLNWGIVKS